MGLTKKNLRAHDSSQLPLSRQSWRSPDEESSVYSVDQEGFYTSMHNDSGLRRSGIDLIAEEDPISLTPIEPQCVQQHRAKRKHRRRSASLLDNISSGRRSKKKSPPPMTAHKNHSRTMDRKDFPTPPSPGEIKKVLSSDEGSMIMSSFALPPSEINSPPPPVNDMSFSESDAETIYARVKVKSSISSSAYPSLCFLDDEEDGYMLSYSKSWRKRGSSIPEGLTRIPSHEKKGPTTSQDDSYVQSNKENDLAECYTWPRSPRTNKDSSILISPWNPKVSHPPRILNFAPSVTMFDSATGLPSEGALVMDHSLYETKRGLKPTNTFRESSDESLSSGLSSSSSENCVIIDPHPSVVKSCDVLNKYETVVTGSSKKVAIPIIDSSNNNKHVFANVVVRDPDNKSATPNGSPHKQYDDVKRETCEEIITHALQPKPASAQLIISSHVATKVSFKENPYKRSICSPVSNDDLVSFWNFTGRDRSRERTPIEDKLVPRPSETGNMKQYTSCSTTSDKTNYGRSWYDGIETTSSMVVIPVSTTTQCDALSSSRPQGFNNFIIDKHRDSTSNIMCSDSGWKSRFCMTSPVPNRCASKPDGLSDEKVKPPRPQHVIPEQTMLPPISSDPDQDEPDVMLHKDLSTNRPSNLHIISKSQPGEKEGQKEKVVIKAQVTPTNSLGKRSSVKVTYPLSLQKFVMEDMRSMAKKQPRPLLPTRSNSQIIPITTRDAAPSKTIINTMSSFRPAEPKVVKSSAQTTEKASSYPIVKVQNGPVVKIIPQVKTAITSQSTVEVIIPNKSNENTICPIISDIKLCVEPTTKSATSTTSSLSTLETDIKPAAVSGKCLKGYVPAISSPYTRILDRPSAFSTQTFGIPVLKFTSKPKPASSITNTNPSLEKNYSSSHLSTNEHINSNSDTETVSSVIQTKPPTPSITPIITHKMELIDLSLSSSRTNLSRVLLGKSSESLASHMTGRSLDSMGSNGSGLSHRAEMTRYSKISFLESSTPPSQETSIDDRFSRFKKPSTVPQTTTEKRNAQNTPDLCVKTNRRSDKGAPIQGRFVNSMITHYLSKSRESLTSPCSSVASSGLGSSVTNSPTSPSKTNSCFSSPTHPAVGKVTV